MYPIVFCEFFVKKRAGLFSGLSRPFCGGGRATTASSDDGWRTIIILLGSVFGAGSVAYHMRCAGYSVPLLVSHYSSATAAAAVV